MKPANILQPFQQSISNAVIEVNRNHDAPKAEELLWLLPASFFRSSEEKSDTTPIQKPLL